jgi:two-component system, NtrC family, sensor kinase
MKTEINNEISRLSELYSYSILDTKSELHFDELAILASSICQTPIAMVGLVDAERIWFKAEVGVKFNQVPREHSFCAYALEQDHVFEVEDTLRDERFATQESILKKGIRFYAGVPLKTSSGIKLGTICVMDKVARKLTYSQKGALRVLAHQVMSLLELKKSYQHIIKQQNILDRKLAMEVLGRTAGSLCHDINNPLTIMKGRLIIMRSRIVDLEDENFEDIEIMDQMVDRISHSVKDLSQAVGEVKRKKVS